MKSKAYALLMALCFCLVTSGRAQEKEDIINLAVPVPAESKKGGWKPSAEASESFLTASWVDSAGQKYSTPIVFYEYPNGTFGAIAKIQAISNALSCLPSNIPLAQIKKNVPLKGTIELVPDSPTSYKGYSLLDQQGRPTQFLEVIPVGKNKEELAFSSGTLHLVFPGGSPNAGIEMLPQAPGTRLMVHPGVIADGMKLAKGTLVIDIVLRDIVVQEGSTRRTIKDVLVRKVSAKEKETPEIMALPKGQ